MSRLAGSASVACESPSPAMSATTPTRNPFLRPAFISRLLLMGLLSRRQIAAEEPIASFMPRPERVYGQYFMAERVFGSAREVFVSGQCLVDSGTQWRIASVVLPFESRTVSRRPTLTHPLPAG